MELEASILARRSVRKYKSIPVPDDIIEKMLKMAQAAPSGGNGQSHIFGVVRDADKRRELAEAAGNQMWIADAPVVFACCARLDEDYRSLPEGDFTVIVNKLRWGGDFYNYLMEYPNWNSVACLLANAAPLIPAEHIALEAAANGLSSCFIGFLDVDRASAALGLPDDIRCLFLLPVGYADEQPGSKKLKALDEISFNDVYKRA